MRISDWSSEVCASDLLAEVAIGGSARPPVQAGWNIPRVMADRQSATASSLSCLAAQDRMSDAEFIVDMMMWLARRGLTFFAAPSRTESTRRTAEARPVGNRPVGTFNRWCAPSHKKNKRIDLEI